MCSHEEITWKTVRNVVARRMVDNSLTHKFLPSQKIRKRTKLFNAEVKKRGIIKNYEQYVEIKTSVLRKVANDCDTDDSDNLSDIDYSIIYNSESKLNEYRRKDSTKMFTSDEDELINKAMNKMRKNSKAKSVKKKTKKLVNIEQQEDSLSQVCITSNESGNDKEKNQAMSKMKNGKVKPVKKNTKTVNIRQQENYFSQVCFTSNKDSNDKEKSQAIRKMKSSKTKPVEKSMKTSVNIEWQEDFTSQTLFTDDDNINNNEKENQIILKKKKNNKTKPSEKKKSVNIGWQEVVKKNRSTTHISDTRQCIDTLNISKQNISQIDKCNHSKANSNKRSLSPKLESQDSISCIAKSVSEDIPQNHSKPITVMSESDCQLNSPNSVTSYKVEPVNEDTTRNHEDSKAVANETNFETKCQDNAVACKMNPEEETMIQKEFKVPHSSPINDPSSISKRLPSVSKDRSCEKPTKVEENSISAKNYDACVSPQPIRSIDNVKRNLAFVLDTVDCSHQASSPNASHDQQKDSGIDEDSQDKFIKQLCTENLDNTENIVEKISVSPEHEEINEMTGEIQEDYTNDINLQVDDDSLKEQDITDNIETQIRETQVSQIDDSPEIINQTDTKDAKVNGADNITEDSCSIQEKQLKIMSTEIVNKRYRIVIEKGNDMNVTHEDAKRNPLPVKLHASSNSSIISDDTDACIEMANEIPIAQQVVNHEEDEEEDDAARCVSPQTKKQLQRHEQLNLIVDSNSSESENENRSAVERNSKIVHMNNSGASYYVENNSEDETIQDGASRKIDTDTSYSDATCKDAHAPLEDEEKSCASKKNDADASHGEDSRERLCEQQEKKLENDEKSHTSEESGIDISHDKNNRENASGEERLGSDKRNSSEEKHNGLASENGRNTDDEGSQCQDRASSCELETQNVCYRPQNLEELVEDEELLVETLPASITLADINEDEEVFILNIPNKVLQCNLQGQQMILKEKTIRFGKSKFRVMHNQVSTVSCVFATGKRRKPYKIVNLKEISTITIRERLSNSAENSTELDSRGTDTFPVRKSKKRRHILSSDDDMDNRQTDKSKSKKLKVADYYRPRRRDND